MKRKWMIFLVVVVVLAGGAFVVLRVGAQRMAAAQETYQTAPLERGSLRATIGASGSVRSNQSAYLSWLTSGTVKEVRAAVGDTVASGDELATLAVDSVSQSVILARADLINAEKALDDLMNSRLQQAQALQAVEDAQTALDDLKNSELTLAEAQQAVANAQKAVEDNERKLRYSQSTASQSYIDEARAQVVLAKDRLDKAKERYEPYANKAEDNLIRANLLSQQAAAQQQYDAAVRNLNAMLGTANETDQAVAQANLDQAQAQLVTAQRELDRVLSGTTPAEVAIAEAQLEDAQREWERLKDGPDSEDIAMAQAKIDAARSTLNGIHVTAPFAGVITQASSRPGDQVSPGTVAFRVDDLTRLLADVEVSEVDINAIEIGQAVVLTFDSILGQEYNGKVVEVSPVGTAEQGVVNFIVTVELLDADDQVKPGMTVSVSIITSQLSDILLIPSQAVRMLDGERVVYVLRNGAPTPVPVTLGQASETHNELLAGDLQEGDPIVLNPPSNPFPFDMEDGGPGSRSPFGGGSQ